MAFPIVAFALAGVAAWAARRLAALASEREMSRRLPAGADGIIRGAHPIEYVGGTRGGALLVHGFGDTPQTLHYVAERLHREGYAVRVPLLPGHGRSLRAFAATRHRDWLDHMRAELRILRDKHGPVPIVGLSMGGALSTLLAAEFPDTPALVLAAPYLTVSSGLRRAARLHHVAPLVTTYLRTRGEGSIRDTSERPLNLAYGYATPRLLRELRDVVDAARAQLGRLSVPTLMLQSREDRRTAEHDAARAFELIGAPVKRIVWLENCSHLVTVDRCREQVMDEAVAWLGRHHATVASHQPGADPALTTDH